MVLFVFQVATKGEEQVNAEPLISVIVPVYEVEPWLERCVKSIRNQTYRNLEIILVDDGSPDRCGDMCDRLAREDKRITVIHRDNGGLSAARNTGLSICRGEYIGFVDSDDVIHPDMYSRLYADICAFGTELAFCQPLINYGPTVSFPQTDDTAVCLSKDDILLKALSDGIWFSAWTKLYHRRLFDGLRYPESRTNEDYPITIRVFDRCDRIAVDFNHLYVYCKRAGSITTSSSIGNAFDQIISAEDVLVYLKDTHPNLVGQATRILLSATIGYLLKTDGDLASEHKKERNDVFAIIRKYYSGERPVPKLSFSQKFLLSAARAGESRYAAASRIYLVFKSLLYGS